MSKIKSNSLILSWALYDLANQFFALNIVSLYFPRWLTLEKGAPEILYSFAFGVSMFFVALCAPILGAISDTKASHKKFLVYFTLVSIIFTMALGFSSNLFLVLAFFVIANFGCQGAVVFYNALMVRVAPKDKVGMVSGLGRMFGYTGAILALYITKPVILEMGYQPTFIITGILFLIFSLPCLIFVKEAPSNERPGILNRREIVEAFRRLRRTLSDTHRYGSLKDFLKAAFFGLCVVNTIILFMAVYVGKVFGFKEADIINLIAFSTIFAILGSVISGFISDIIGYRRSLIGVFFLWLVCLLSGGLLSPPFHWIIGALVGLSLGSTWVIARALLVKLVPKEKIGEVFGLFNMVGYIAGIVGPFFWGILLLYFSSLGAWGYRLTLLSLSAFIIVGIFFLFRIPRLRYQTT